MAGKARGNRNGHQLRKLMFARRTDKLNNNYKQRPSQRKACDSARKFKGTTSEVNRND